MSLGFTNITVTLAKNAISESVNSVGGLCSSTKINQWSWYKPGNYGSLNSVQAHDSMIECNGRASSTYGYRLGDFRGYNHDAKAPLTFYTGQTYYLNKSIDVGTNYGQIVPYLVRGEMPACTNNDGFYPDFVADQTAITLIPELYQSTTLKYTASETTINYSTTPVGNIIELSPITPSTINAGTYTLKVKQKNNLLNQGYIQNEVPFVVQNVQSYDLSGSSYLWWDSATIYKPLKMAIYLIYDYATSPSTLQLSVDMSITSSANGVLFKSNGLTTITGTVTATVGSLTTKGYDTIGDFVTGDTIQCTVKNYLTGYIYEQYSLTI